MTERQIFHSLLTTEDIVEEYSFDFNGQKVRPDKFKDDFLPQLESIVDRFVPRPANSFLEWGSGISTILLAKLAAQRQGQLVTIDEQRDYQLAVLEKIPARECVQSYVADLMGPKLSQEDVGLNYSTLPLALDKTFDFILIDGRRRMECAFVALMIAHRDTIVALHDYRRTRYQLALALFDLIEDGDQFRVLKPKGDLHAGLVAERDTLREIYRHGVY